MDKLILLGLYINCDLTTYNLPYKMRFAIYFTVTILLNSYYHISWNWKIGTENKSDLAGYFE